MKKEDYLYIFSQMLQMSNDGFIVVDTDGNVTDINEAYCEFLGIKRNQTIGNPITIIIPNSKMLRVVKEGYEDKLALHRYVPGYTKDAENNFVLVSRSCVKNEKGEIVAGIAQVHFPNQAVELAKRVMREYNELEIYREQYKEINGKKYSFFNIVGNNPEYMDRIKKGIAAAKTNFPVLLQGETGTGKEVFARAIHNMSERAEMPMVCVNCAAIPTDLLESELFGYAEGAFTGAKKGGKKGKFQLAHKGTLFLDEIGDMPISMQAKLLRVLQEKEIDVVGGAQPLPVDVRIISATRKNLPDLIKKNEFREDLFYRLNVINIEMIPLRERQDDIAKQARFFLASLNEEYHKEVDFSSEVLAAFCDYSWPGNLRELDNIIKGAYASCDGIMIQIDDLPMKFHTHTAGQNATQSKPLMKTSVSDMYEETGRMTLKEKLERYEYDLMINSYQRFKSVRKAADNLGMSCTTFVRRKNALAKKFDISNSN